MKHLSKFKNLVYVTFSMLSILIGIFLILNTFVHPRVVNIDIKGGKNNSALRSQQIKVEFNRPIDKETIKDNITIEPQIEFRTLWSGNTLIILPNTTLESQTEYRITFKRDIKDIYGDEFLEDYIFNFTTELPKFAFIERSPLSNSEAIVIYNAHQQNKEELIRRDNIKYYGINQNYLVIVTEKNYTNNIEILNRKNGEIKNFNLNNTRINSFSFSPSEFKNEFAFTKQDITVYPNYYLPKSDIKVVIYNIDSLSENIFNPKDTAKDVTFIDYSRDGESIIYKSGDSFFNLAEVNNQDNIISIGRFLSSGNFSSDSSKIVFLDYDPLNAHNSMQFITVFNSNRDIKNLTDGKTAVLDPIFKNRSDLIIYSEMFKELEGTKGIFKIAQIDQEGNKTDIIKSENFSLELPQLSTDDRFISFEQYTQINLKDYSRTRSLEFQNKPYYGLIVIFDTKISQIFDNNLLGVDVTWL